MNTPLNVHVFKFIIALFSMIVIPLLSGCFSDVDQGDGGEFELEIKGTYTDDFSGNHVIGNSMWEMDTLLFNYVFFSNADDFLVAQNDDGNAFNPGLYSRMDWTRDDNDDLYFCQIAFAEVSADEAEAVTTADNTDLSSGCGGFSWSQLIPQ